MYTYFLNHLKLSIARDQPLVVFRMTWLTTLL